MADKTGYIGRNPNDSAVTVARQFFTASGVTTTFTFASGYLTGFLDVYVDGVKRRVADEFTATDGSTFDVLQGGVSAGSTVEAVAYKAFNAAAISGDITGNFDVSGNTTLGGSLSVTGGTTFSNINVTGIATLGAGTTVAFANTAFNLGGTPDITIASLSAVDINVSGAATIGGILTYEDVTNIDSLGIVTARTGVEVTANGLVVNAGVSTFAADVSVADKIVHTGDANTAIRFPSADTITAETAGSERLRISSGGDVTLAGIATVFGATGIVSATSFDGDLTGDVTGNLTGTASNASGATGDFSIADKIVHTGDTNTAIRFPAADTFTVETSGSEQFRIGSDGLLTGKGAQFNSNITPTSGNGVEIFASTSTLGFIQAFDRTNSSQGNLTIKGNSISLVGGSSEVIGISSGATASFAGDLSIADKIIHTGDTNTAIRFPAADTFTVETSGSEALRIDSSGRLLLGTTTEGQAFADDLTVATSSNTGITIRSGSSEVGSIYFSDDTSGPGEYDGFIQYNHSTRLLQLGSAAETRLRIDSTGRITAGKHGLGTSNDASEWFKVQSDDSAANISIVGSNDTHSTLNLGDEDDFNIQKIKSDHTNNSLQFYTADGERLRIDSSGRLLLGNTSSRSNVPGSDVGFQIEGASGGPTNKRFTQHIYGSGDGSGPYLGLAKHRGTSVGGNTIVVNGDELGGIYFQGADGTNFKQGAFILAEVDGTPGTDDMPGALRFATTADGSDSPTERLRIDSRGSFQFSNGFMNETVNINSTARNGTQAVNLDDGMVHYFTASSTASWKPNFTMSSGNDINATIATGDTFSVTMIVNKSNTSHIATSAQVDGSDIGTIEFLGGTPSAGGGNNTFDIYSYTIIKTGNDAFTAFISVSTYE